MVDPGNLARAALESVTKRGGEVLRRVPGVPRTLDRGPLTEDAQFVIPGICPGCHTSATPNQFSEFGVCRSCGHHLRIPAAVRLEQLVDPGTFREADRNLAGGNPLEFVDSMPYPLRVAEARRRTGLTEAVVTGNARIGGHQIGIAVFDFRFLGGSMGAAVGEKLVRLFERCTEERRPVIVVASSGGARMQEGTVALSQMARVAAAVERHHQAGLLYISILADPTTGGVMVSPASMGDIVLAEPGAYAAFAGQRVSDGSAALDAEWLQVHGMVDAVVSRPDLRSVLISLVSLLTHQNRPLRRGLPAVKNMRSPGGPGDTVPADAWNNVQLVRRDDRPGAREYIRQMTGSFIELHGDRLHGDDESIVGGVGRFMEQSVILLGQDRYGASDGHPPGKPYPEGFRKVLRLALLAAKFGLPILTLVDTEGAQADVETEGRGLAYAIGRCLRVFSTLPVPIIAAIIGEGGSGGAIALAVADRVLMLEHAVYEVIRPEGAAAILYRDPRRAPDLAGHMRITAAEAHALGVVDVVVPEPPGGAQADPGMAAELLAAASREALAEAQRWLPDRLLHRRYRRLREMGRRFLGEYQPEREDAPRSAPESGATVPVSG